MKTNEPEMQDKSVNGSHLEKNGQPFMLSLRIFLKTNIFVKLVTKNLTCNKIAKSMNIFLQAFFFRCWRGYL